MAAPHRQAAERALAMATVRRRVEEGLEALRRGNAAAALEAFSAARRLAARWRLGSDVEAGILTNLALALSQAGRYRRALAACRAALSRPGLELEQRAALLNTAGELCGHAGRHREAAGYFARAYRLLRGKGAVAALAAANAALAWREASMPARALRWAERALRAAEALPQGDRAGLVARQFACVQRAAALGDLGRVDEAEAVLAGLCSEPLRPEVEGDVLRLQAELAWRRGDAGAAAAWAARAADLAVRAGSPEDLAVALALREGMGPPTARSGAGRPGGAVARGATACQAGRKAGPGQPAGDAAREVLKALKELGEWVGAFWEACAQMGVEEDRSEPVVLALVAPSGWVVARAGPPEARDRAAALGITVGARLPAGRRVRGLRVPLDEGDPSGPQLWIWPRQAVTARAAAALVARLYRQRAAEQARAEQELTLAKLSAFHEAALTVGGPMETGPLIRALLALTCRAVAADGAGLLFPPSGEAHTQGLDEGALRASSLSARVGSTGRPLRWDAESPSAREELLRLGVRALVAVPVYFGGSAPCGAVLVAARRESRPFRERDVELLTFISRQFGLALENAALRDDLRRRLETLTRELQVARRLQQTLMPEGPVREPGVAIAGLSLPARHVGGDVLGYWRQDDGSWVVAVGDVMGKGVAAAMLGSILYHRLRQVLREEGFGPAAVEKLAGVMWDDLCRARALATLVLLRFDPQEGSVAVLAAGHPGPLRGRSGTWEGVPVPGGMALGLRPYARAGAARWRPQEGELVLLYSDGFGELLMGSRGLFREADLARALGSRGCGSPGGGPEEVLRAVRELAEGRELTDDVTVVAVQVGGPTAR